MLYKKNSKTGGGVLAANKIAKLEDFRQAMQLTRNRNDGNPQIPQSIANSRHLSPCP